MTKNDEIRVKDFENNYSWLGDIPVWKALALADMAARDVQRQRVRCVVEVPPDLYAQGQEELDHLAFQRISSYFKGFSFLYFWRNAAYFA